MSRCGEGRKSGSGRVDFDGPLKHPSRDARWAAGYMGLVAREESL